MLLHVVLVAFGLTKSIESHHINPHTVKSFFPLEKKTLAISNYFFMLKTI
jgi:hypothetical protein